jgi:hypothetical protein
MPTATAHSVLAADLAEFRLQPETLGVRPPGGDARGDDVLGVRQRGRVEHDGSEAAVHWAAQQPFVGDVVEVQRHGNGGRLGERGGGAGHRGEPAAVEPHGVLADLTDDRAAHGFRPGDHGLGMLQGDHVVTAPTARPSRHAELTTSAVGVSGTDGLPVRYARAATAAAAVAGTAAAAAAAARTCGTCRVLFVLGP